MRFYYISDLHLERAKNIIPFFPSKAHRHPLFLAGDLGNVNQSRYQTLLEHVTDKFEQVYLIAGNHEYGRLTTEDQFREMDYDLKSLVSKFGNVHFLNRQSVQFGNYIIAGCTFWTHVPFPTTTRLKTQNERHQQDLAFIKDTIHYSQLQDKDLIIMTHHLPSFKLIMPQFHRYNPCGWASHSDHLLQSPIKAWICGHTHIQKTFAINKIPIFINAKSSTTQIGYC